MLKQRYDGVKMVNIVISISLLLAVTVLACSYVAAGVGHELSSVDSVKDVDVTGVLAQAQACGNHTMAYYNITQGNVSCVPVGT